MLQLPNMCSATKDVQAIPSQAAENRHLSVEWIGDSVVTSGLDKPDYFDSHSS